MTISHRIPNRFRRRSCRHAGILALCVSALVFPAAAQAGSSLLPPSAQAWRGESPGRASGRTIAVPQKAINTYRYVLTHGRPPQEYVGGRVWENREGRLPRGGRYREYDVNPKVRGRNRGPERIIIDSATGKGWYTADHYRTFVPIMSR